jgi:hypothetical protein
VTPAPLVIQHGVVVAAAGEVKIHVLALIISIPLTGTVIVTEVRILGEPFGSGGFLRQVPDFERSLVDSGIRLFKLWFTVSQQRQRERFADRRTDPLKQWKLSPIDEASIERYADYTAARNEMLLASDTTIAPWTIVNSNDKQRARLNAIRSVLGALDYAHKDHDVVGEPDPRVVRPARSITIAGSG